MLFLLQSNIRGDEMSKDFKDMKSVHQRMMELGSIDRWLRGVAGIVPQPSPPDYSFSQERDMHSITGLEVAYLDSNLHILPFGDTGKVADDEIEKMKGFRDIVNAASQNNVRVDIANVSGSALEISFDPDEPFSRSRIFGASYANVLPALFGSKPPVGVKK